MAKKQTARARLYIGNDTVVDYDQADATVAAALEAAHLAPADEYLLVGEVENAGNVGDTYGITEGTAITDFRTVKAKTAARGATQNLILFADLADLGQTRLKAALASLSDYNFKIELADTPAGSEATPTTFYYAGLVTQAEIQLATIQDFVRRAVTIEINTPTIEIPADDGAP